MQETLNCNIFHCGRLLSPYLFRYSAHGYIFGTVNYGICKRSAKTVYREWCYRGVMPTVKRERHAQSEMKGGRSHA